MDSDVAANEAGFIPEDELRGAARRVTTTVLPPRGPVAAQVKRLEIGPLGSRGATLHVIFGRHSVWVETGCFAGTLGDLYRENLQAHDHDSIAYQEYVRTISFLDALARLYRP